MQDGKSALHFSARNGHPAVVEMLLDAKCDVNLGDVVMAVMCVSWAV